MSDLKIYEIQDAILNALDAIEVDAETGEITNLDALEAVKQDAKLLIVSTAKYLAMRGATLKAMEDARKNLDGRIKAEKRRHEWLKDQMLKGMTVLGVKQIEAPDILVKKGKLPPSVLIVDEAQIPAEFIKTETRQTVDKGALAQALKQGAEIPGAVLVTNGEKVIIR